MKFYNHHKWIFRIILFCSVFAACSKSMSKRLDLAEEMVETRPDSAAMLLERIDYFYLDEEQKARYALTKAIADVNNSHTLVTDTMLPQAIDYFGRTGDSLRLLKSQLVYVKYLSERNMPDSATRLLDRMLSRIPADSVDRRYQLTAMRATFRIQQEDFPGVIEDAEWLMFHTSFMHTKLWAAQIKMYAIHRQGRKRAAVEWGDSVIASELQHIADKGRWIDFMGDYAELLDEAGESAKAIAVIEQLLRGNPQFSSDEKFGYFASLAKFHINAGNAGRSQLYLDSINSLESEVSSVSRFGEFRSYLEALRAVIDYKQTGHLSLLPDNMLAKEHVRQRRMNDDAVSEMNRLSAWKMQLTLEKKNMTILLLSISLGLVILAFLLVWMLRRRKVKLTEAQERIETLDTMLRQVNRASAVGKDSDRNSMLKEMVLRQMGILKTFASSPTTQNQEVLRKISAIGREAEGTENLVDWQNLYSMVDELYGGFHTALLRAFPDTFSEKEVQIICLLRADFSTKEISVLTRQSSATIYVRKSAIRKKLGTPEGGDFMAQIDAKIGAAQSV